MPPFALSESVRPEQPLNAATFADFYRDEFDLIVAFLIRSGAHSAEAEDSAQTAMVALWRDREIVREPRAWVRIVARRCWLRTVRVQARVLSEPAADDGIAVTDAGVTADPVRMFHSKIEAADAARVIGILPPIQRRILALTVDGYRPAEIASILRSDSAVVRSNLAHARRRMRATPLWRASLSVDRNDTSDWSGHDLG